MRGSFGPTNPKGPGGQPGEPDLSSGSAVKAHRLDLPAADEAILPEQGSGPVVGAGVNYPVHAKDTKIQVLFI